MAVYKWLADDIIIWKLSKVCFGTVRKGIPFEKFTAAMQSRSELCLCEGKHHAKADYITQKSWLSLTQWAGRIV